MRDAKKHLLPLILILSQVSQAMGDTNDAFQFFEEEAKVVTASRRPQTIQDSPVAVEVITAEDIKASGAVNIWDVMRFHAGMNVIEGTSRNGNRAIVSIRGFADEFVRSLQVLVDGRSVYDMSSGGVLWEQLPVPLQDIERIEIVRGPNAALYGSNAGLGVINIITKRPQGAPQLSATAIEGNLGTHMSAETAEGSIKDFRYRLSHAYRENGGYPLASTGATANDYLHENKVNFRGSWDSHEGTSLDIFSGGVWENSGIPPTAALTGKPEANYQLVKLAHAGDDDSAIEAMASRSLSIQDNTWTTQYDSDALYRLGWMDQRFYTMAGVSYRRATVRSGSVFQGEGTLLNEIIRGFANQSLKLTDKLSLIGAVSAEDSTSGGMQPAYQAAALYRVAPEYGFRASYSVAPTLPSLVNQHGNYQSSSSLRVLGNPDFKSQKLTSYEVGYRGSYHRWTTDASLYYMSIRNFENRVITPFPPPVEVTFDNSAGAIARGAEMGVTYRFKPAQSVYANYTYEHISSTSRLTTIDHGTPAHMVNMGGMSPLGRGFSLSINIGFKDDYIITSNSRSVTVAVPVHTRVDARLGYVPPPYPWVEVFLACQNMTQSDHVEFADGLTVPRTYQGGVSVKFGGNK